MRLPSVVITEGMNEQEKRAAVERAILIELQAVSESDGWQMLVGGLQQKHDRLMADLTDATKMLDPRVEDRMRGEIAAYRDVLQSVQKAEARVALLDQTAATIKEQERERDAADDLDGLDGYLTPGA